MRVTAGRRSGSKAKGHRHLAPGWEREWRDAAAVERDELRRGRAEPTREAWAGLATTGVVAALLPAILPLSSGGAGQAVAAAIAATAAISIVPASLAAAGARWRGAWSVERALLYAVALAVASAAAIHLAVAKEHFAEYTLFGLFFVGAGIAQLVWGAWIVLRPSRALLALGAAGNLLIAVLWVVDRVQGLPIGPGHGKPHPVGFADTLTSVLELLVAAGCLALLRREQSRARADRRVWLLLALPAVVLTTLGLLSAVGLASSVLTPAG